jgi:predicted nucleic acid-binding protein
VPPLVFVDSSAWIAILNPRDQYNARAVGFFRTLNRTTLVTTNYVLSEAVTWFMQSRVQRFGRRLKEIIDASRQSHMLRLAWIDEAVHNAAWDLLERHEDQGFSFCDCTSFVVARSYGVDSVFSFDSDFVRMGFSMKPDQL